MQKLGLSRVSERVPPPGGVAAGRVGWGGLWGRPGTAAAGEWLRLTPWESFGMLRKDVAFPAVLSFSAGKIEAREALNEFRASA